MTNPVYQEGFSYFYSTYWTKKFGSSVLNFLQSSVDLSGKSILDVACGTGEFANLIKTTELPLEVFGLEASSANRDRASAKIGSHFVIDWKFGDKIPFEDRKFDLVTCLYDSLNYCSSDNQLQLLFDEVSRVLSKNSIFLFDFNTSEGLQKRWNGVIEKSDKLGKCRVEFLFDPTQQLGTASISGEFQGIKFEEIHHQKPIDPENVKAVLKACHLIEVEIKSHRELLPSEVGREFFLVQKI